MRWSLRDIFYGVTIIALIAALVTTLNQARGMRSELGGYRDEVGYLRPTADTEIAASRAPLDGPLEWKFRIRVPPGRPRYRFVYSTWWRQHAAAPQWFGAIPIEPGESRVTMQILQDPRDDIWKVSAIVASVAGTRRMATTLPLDQVPIFRGSHERMRSGVDRGTTTADVGQSIRVLDDRWLVGEGALLLFGDRAPSSNQIGVYAELQPDMGTLAGPP